MKKIRAAIIGCGRISVCYEDAFRRLSDYVELVCAIDKDEEKAKAFAEKFNCPYCTDLESALQYQIDVVHLCLPHYLHPVMAVKAMEAGIHVLTEKPIGVTLQDADLMIETSRRTGKKLGVIFQTRYTKSVEKIKELMAAGVFGKITAARSYLTWNRPASYYSGNDWKGTWDKEGGGVLIDQAIHSMDRVRYILDSDIEWIEGSIHNHCHPMVHVEDTAEAAIQFKNGCLYSLYACNSYSSDAPINIEFQGEKGRCGLLQDMGFYEVDGCYTEIRNTYETETVGPDYWGSSHHLQILDFYKSVAEDLPVAIDGTEGRKTLEMVKGIYKSSLERKRIYLPFEDVKYKDLNTPE